MTQADLEKAVLEIVSSQKSNSSEQSLNPLMMQMFNQKSGNQSPYTIYGQKNDPMQQYWLMQNLKNPNDPMQFQQLQSITGKQQASVLGLALGVALSSFVGSIFARFLPLGGLTVPIAGFILMKVFKSGIMHDIAIGVLVAGVGGFLGGFVGGLTGGLSGLTGGLLAAPAGAASGTGLAPGEVA